MAEDEETQEFREPDETPTFTIGGFRIVGRNGTGKQITKDYMIGNGAKAYAQASRDGFTDVQEVYLLDDKGNLVSDSQSLARTTAGGLKEICGEL